MRRAALTPSPGGRHGVPRRERVSSGAAHYKGHESQSLKSVTEPARAGLERVVRRPRRQLEQRREPGAPPQPGRESRAPTVGAEPSEAGREWRVCASSCQRRECTPDGARACRRSLCSGTVFSSDTCWSLIWATERTCACPERLLQRSGRRRRRG